MSTLEFRLIAGYDSAYRISACGVVQSCRKPAGTGWILSDTWRTLLHGKNDTGHHTVGLRLNGEQKHCYVHRLILLAFGPPMPFPGALALHKDDNPDNNNIDNLYWGTSKQNRADAMRSGRAFIPKGEENGKAILTPAEVEAIRAFPRKRGYRLVLAAKHHVSVAAIKDIISGRSWATVVCKTPAAQTYGTGPDAGRRRKK